MKIIFNWFSCVLWVFLVAAPLAAQDDDEDLFTLTEEELDAEEDPDPDPDPDADPDSDPDPDSASASASASASEDDTEPDPDDFTLREVVAAWTPQDIFRVGGSAQLIGEEDLETLEYDDPHSTLLSVPGLYVRHEDGFGLRPNIGLRGGNPERSKKVTLMEDGVLFGPAPYAAPAAYYFPLMTRMTGIEVFKGPAALLYGPQTIGGAVNLITRAPPRDPSGELDLSYGMFRSRKIHFHYGASTERVGFLFEALDVGSQGFKDVDFSEQDSGFSRSDFILRGFAQTDVSADVFNRVDLRLGFGRELSHETYLGLTDADFENDPYRRYIATERDRMRWWRMSSVLTWTLEVGENVRLTTQAYRHDFSRSWLRFNRFGDESQNVRDVLLQPTGRRAVYYDVLTGAQNTSSADEQIFLIDNDRRFVSQGGQTALRVSAETGPLRHAVELGVRFHQDEIDREHTEHGYLMLDRTLVGNGDGPQLVTANEGWAFAFAGYLVYGLEVAGLTLSPGIRTEVIKTRFDDALAGTRQDELRAVALPGIGAQYELIDHLGVFAGVHRGFSPVAPGQGPDVEPELSINYELGLRYSDPDEGRLLEATGFLNDYSNLTGQCAFSTGCSEAMLDQQFNAGSVFVWGVEAVAAWTFEVYDARIPVRATYTYTGSHFREAFESDDPTLGSVEEGDQLPYIPEHQGQLQIGVEHDRGGARVVGTYVAAMREEAGQGDEGERTDAYGIVDVVGWAQVRPRVRAYIRLENILNQQPIASRRPFGARPVRPAMFQLGVKVDL